jgi:hypothetical protein
MSVRVSADRSEAFSYSHPWLAELLFALDRRLQRRHGILEYSQDAACIFRLEICPADRDLLLRDGTAVRRGDRIARLHYWNEQMPLVHANGTMIGWGREFRHRIALSLVELARYLDSRSDLRDIEVVCADVANGGRQQSEKIAWIMARYGFETIAEPGRLPLAERIRRLGENILISLMVFVRNSAALRLDSLRRVRVPIYLSRRALEQRFGMRKAYAGTAAGRP